MRVWAHRGMSALYPENTLPAFEAALAPDLDIEGIELDVHLTADDVPVVCHDEDVKRTSDGRGKIAQMTFAELRKLDFSQVKGKDFANVGACTIPSLDEVLELVRASGKRVNIELKTDKNPYPGIEQRVVGRIRAFGLEERVLVSSFREDSVLRFKTIAPEIETGFLFTYPPRGLHAKIAKGRWDAVHPRFSRVPQSLVDDAHAHGMAVRVYTVDDPVRAKRFAEMGVDAIFSNDPAAMLAALA